MCCKNGEGGDNNKYSMEKLDNIRELITKFSYLGTKQTANKKALLIGHAPQIAPEAWLNCLYKPVSLKEIQLIEKSIGVSIPDSYKSFLLSFSNGLSILGDTLSLFGYRSNYSRNNEDVWQPYDIITLNLYEKPHNATLNEFLIGKYEWDASSLYINKEDEICYCKSDDILPLKKWNSLSDMLYEELTRLYELVSENGLFIDTDCKTTPA